MSTTINTIVETVPGFRRNLADSLVANCPGLTQKRYRSEELPRLNGYLSALYVLRMNELPPAYMRSGDVASTQHQIDQAIARIEMYRDSKVG
jgi:hypothetical protein